MCQRITRQSNAAKVGGRRGRRDAIDVIRDLKKDKELKEEKGELGEREGRNYHHHREQLDKQLADQLRIKVISLTL